MTSTSSSAPDLNDIVFNDWVEHWLPRSWRPYARLCRLDRPIGTWLTLLPCIAALVQAAGGFPSLKRLVVFSLGALLMRGIGCTVNDMCDRNFDKHVERTDEKTHYSERSYGSFTRAFTLPWDADRNGISANFAKGVLTLQIAKTAGRPERAREIDVQPS